MKLSTNNFILWRNQITPLVRSLGVLHHLLSEEKPEKEVKGATSEKSPNPNYSKWITNDGLLCSWLLGTMKEEVLTMINGDTAYEIWTFVKEHLLPATIEKARSLKNMLMTIKKGSRTLEEYLREFKSICDNLAAIKETVSDQDKVFQFAYGLGPSYETFRVAMLTKPPYPSFSQFLLAPQGHEQIQNAQKEEEKSLIEHAQAFFSQRGRGRGRSGLGGRGHFNSQGRGFTPVGRYNGPQNNEVFVKHNHSSKGEKPRQINESKSACQICIKLNHEAVDCWYRYDYSYQSEDFPQALAALALNDTKDQSFIVDSGATSHMINDAGNLSYVKTYHGNDVIYVGDGNNIPITHTGDVNVVTSNGNLKLKDVLVVPDLKKNLLSVGKFVSDNQCIFELTSAGFVIKDQSQKMIARGHKKEQLYTLDGGYQEALSAIRGGSPSTVWHQRLGHQNFKILSLLKDKINVTQWVSKLVVCVSCQMGKNCKLPFQSSNKISEFPLDKIHCDLWGSAPTTSNQNFRYYALFIDDYSRFSWIYPLKKKSGFLECFLRFQKLVENQLDRKIKIFQCDGGGEFNSNSFLNHLHTCGIELHVSCPGTPEQNGTTERKHRHIVEIGLTMMFHANIPLPLWVEVFLTAVYLINRLPLSTLKNESPYFKLFKRHPQYNGLRVIGCQCFPSLRHQGKNKFSAKTYPCIFIGYSPMHKGYRCLDQRPSVFTSLVMLFLMKRLSLSSHQQLYHLLQI